ncbi:hypothetical protein Tco_0882336 [Tanacetum coccineum]
MSAPAKEDVYSKKPSRKKSAGVVIRDTPDVSVSKKKASAKRDSDDDDNQQSDDERTESDDDKIADLNKTDDEEEDEFVNTLDDYVPTDDENVDDEEFERINEEMYSDVNVELKDSEREGKEKDDEEMTDAGRIETEHDNINQEVAAQATTIPLQIPPFIPLQQQLTLIPTPTTTEATTLTTAVPDSETLSAIHLRVSNLKKEVKEAYFRSQKQQEPKYTIVLSNVDALQEFDQKRTFFKTMTKTKSFEQNSKHKALYHALMESILEDEDAMDKGLKKKKTSKDVKPSKKAKSTESSKGTTKSLPKSTGKSAQAEDTVFEAGYTQGPQNLRDDMGNTDEPPVVNVDPKDWFKKPERPLTLDPKWNEGKTVDNKPTYKWLSDLAKAETSSKTFYDLMSHPIDFSAFVMNRLQISDLTQDILIGPSYKILKGTCRSYVELKYNMEECYKALTEQLDWDNPEGGSTDRTYTTYLTKTKAVKYDLPGIEYMVPNLWSPIKVAYDKHALLVTNVKVNIWYGYGHLEEIKVQRSDQQLLFDLKGEDIVHLAVALRMFTRRIVIQKRVEDLQLGVESYQKKLNISKPRTRKEDLSRRAPYTTLLDPQRVIYEDKLNKKRLVCSDELYKFSDGTLQSIRNTLHDMATN